MPSNAFRVTDVFVLKSRGALILIGDVVDGTVRPAATASAWPSAGAG
jgi:hypothetical protein